MTFNEWWHENGPLDYEALEAAKDAWDYQQLIIDGLLARILSDGKCMEHMLTCDKGIPKTDVKSDSIKSVMIAATEHRD